MKTLVEILGQLLKWVLHRPSKTQRRLETMKAEAEIRSIEETQRAKEKNAAFDRAYDHGLRVYRDQVQQQGRRWRLSDTVSEGGFASGYAEEHWKEFLGPD
jgi:hypothetical protein